MTPICFYCASVRLLDNCKLMFKGLLWAVDCHKIVLHCVHVFIINFSKNILKFMFKYNEISEMNSEI
jgi:hypothetical protein